MKHPLFLLIILLVTHPLRVSAENAGVLLLLGAGDKESTVWDGSVSVSRGKVLETTGWRFERTDRIVSTNEWKCSTREAAFYGRANTNRKKAATRLAQRVKGPMQDNGVLIRLADVDESAEVRVSTRQGDFAFKLGDVPYGRRAELLSGRVIAQRTASGAKLTSDRTDDDFPAIAIGANKDLFVAYQSFTPGIDRDERARRWEAEPEDLSFLAKPTGGDQIFLRVRRGQQWNEPLAITGPGRDIYKSSVTVDSDGAAWVFWSERNGQSGFDIHVRNCSAGGQLNDDSLVAADAGNELMPVAATDSNGRVWVAWMAAKDGRFRILACHQTEGDWSQPIEISSNQGNCWNPAIAATKGKVAIAWDTYEKGDYDIWLREFTPDGKPSTPAMAVANTHQYEARASIAYDKEGALWIAWEKSGPTWGKDWGAYDGADGIGLYRDRQIGLIVRKEGRWMEPAGSVIEALPKAQAFSAARFNRGAPPANPETEGTSAGSTAWLDPAQRRGAPGKHAEAKGSGSYNNLGRLVCGEDGRIWCIVRARQNNSRGPVGSVWVSSAAYLDGDRWVGPVYIPHTENLLYNLPAVTAGPRGIVIAHSTDHRMDRMSEFLAARDPKGKGGNAALDSSKDPFDNDVYLSLLNTPPGAARTAVLKPATIEPLDNPQPSARTLAEREEVQRMRDYRAEVAGKTLRILRGEFHRHTEISGDGGNDGPLEDMWRYGIDAAMMDWIGNGDHDNGNGREYTWWLTQKTTDAFHIPGTFDPMFTYERSVSYPEGHRNVVFAQRGVRTLPRLPISDPRVFEPAPDTNMLYKYLHLFGGVCALHTSVGSMGSDWRNNDPVVEPFVEIYQGARQNYERPGAPRCPTEDDAIGGWEPKGFVNLALLKGYRLAFQSSSDHGSTHISYAMIYAGEASREGILQAMKSRHTYAATDNIIADTRCVAADGTERMMGDEFAVKGAPTIKAKFIGTAPFAKITLVKDDLEIPIDAPQQKEVAFEWTDPKPEAGKTSYYYIRGEQTNGELVWASPMWIRSE